jgi:hypothetical protein
MEQPGVPLVLIQVARDDLVRLVMITRSKPGIWRANRKPRAARDPADQHPNRRAGGRAERRTGCASGTVTAAQYRDQRLAAGFTHVTITPTVDAGGGLSSAIVRAVRPAAPDGVLIRPMRGADASGQVLGWTAASPVSSRRVYTG